MTPERRDQALAVIAAIRADITDDVRRRDGLPLTGRNVATALGEICAQIDILAKILGELLDHNQTED